MTIPSSGALRFVGIFSELNEDDYSKIKSIIEMFVGNTPKVDNLFKSLVLFLETKNKIKIIKIT